MKKVIYFILTIVIFISWVGCASYDTYNKALPPEELKVQRIIEINKPKDELYKLSNEWMAKAFKSSKDVIQYQDKEEGVIVGKGSTMVKYLASMRTWFTMTIEIKDNRMRITFEEFFVKTSTGLVVPIETKYEMEQIKIKCDELIDDLKAYVGKEAEEW